MYYNSKNNISKKYLIQLFKNDSYKLELGQMDIDPEY